MPKPIMFYIDKYEILSCDNIDEINVSCKTPNSLIIQAQLHENIESKWTLWTKENSKRNMVERRKEMGTMGGRMERMETLEDVINTVRIEF